MLCSHSSTTTAFGSGASKYTGGLSWLDRLRISKGFPIHHPDLDLDYFLHNSQDSDPNPKPNLHEPAPPSQIDRLAPIIRVEKTNDGDKEEEGELLDLMSIALAELFRMGDPEEYRRRMTDLKHRRNCRKQLNPKSCAVSTFPAEGGCGAGVPSALSLSTRPDDTTTVGVKRKKQIEKKITGKKRAVCEDSCLDPEFAPPQSRTDVTVIDMSYGPDWKSEKIIFKKGDVWRIRDKKLWNLSKKKKKRRLNLVDIVVGEGKKQNLDVVCEVDLDKGSAPTSTNEERLTDSASKRKMEDDNPSHIPKKRLRKTKTSAKVAFWYRE